jgi:hypothetical protein
MFLLITANLMFVQQDVVLKFIFDNCGNFDNG